ncbi:hypothetical protein GCM10007103_32120 [Salinimicrobium marinum]|uniref:Uncharacterized protein n=1 Tax=Salinimicrobium marinum TaxID=680283 RepID=A0A918SK29_9FLAO|nr:hypothetical protein [Salinimicrobium marinum]GHA48849.1 hypothetical protein GCM10007103_32120 [Salinimicrobium marinum]
MDHNATHLITRDAQAKEAWSSDISLVTHERHIVKKMIWLYFGLLLMEGALRKWILPGLATPLLVVRDPVAILIIFYAVRKGLWTPGIYTLLIWATTILSFATALILGHGNVLVALYGLRITVIQFPLIFVIGAILNKEDVLVLGRVLLWICIAMTILVAIQFYSPQSAWVNRGVGGNMAGSGFSGAAGFYRVPGTFSFTNGLSLFYGLAAAFIFYFWAAGENEKVSRVVLVLSSCALLAAIPLSISRMLLFEIVLSALFLIIISFRNPRFIKKFLVLAIIILLLFSVIGKFEFFQTASSAFTERFTAANEVEGGMEGVLVDRLLGGMITAITNENFTFWGAGLGMGTSGGAELLMGDKRGDYLIAEDEWGRIIGEMGLILGLILVGVRIILSFRLLHRSWVTIKKNNILPWMLMSFGFANILQGQWSQPTNLGFVVFIGGLVIASFNEQKASYEDHSV